jgi:hypothetical protein
VLLDVKAEASIILRVLDFIAMTKQRSGTLEPALEVNFDPRTYVELPIKFAHA